MTTRNQVLENALAALLEASAKQAEASAKHDALLEALVGKVAALESDAAKGTKINFDTTPKAARSKGRKASDKSKLESGHATQGHYDRTKGRIMGHITESSQAGRVIYSKVHPAWEGKTGLDTASTFLKLLAKDEPALVKKVMEASKAKKTFTLYVPDTGIESEFTSKTRNTNKVTDVLLAASKLNPGEALYVVDERHPIFRWNDGDWGSDGYGFTVHTPPKGQRSLTGDSVTREAHYDGKRFTLSTLVGAKDKLLVYRDK